jgi:hypothetical protein
MTREPETDRTEPYTRQEAALLLSTILEKMAKRLSTARFRARDSDGEYLAFVRAAVQAITALNQLIKDDELEKLDERLAALERACADAP